jgi:nicotinate-nucleotide adenylyltransferase
LAEAPRWFGFDAIEKIAPPIVLGRAGVAAPGAMAALLPEVSSTQVRAAIARGAWDEVDKLVPREVLAYARARGLYAAPD